MKAIRFRKTVLSMLLLSSLFIQFPQTVRGLTPGNITEAALTEEETESEDSGPGDTGSVDTGPEDSADTEKALFPPAHSFEVDRVYTAGALSLELISVMIRADTWIEENGLENPGYTIDLYYHIRVKEEDNDKSISYTLSDVRLIAEGREYALRNIIRNVEDEISGRNRTADPEGGWRIFCRSFCLTEYGPDGKTELPVIQSDIPMELRFTLTDCSNDAESMVKLCLNKEPL